MTTRVQLFNRVLMDLGFGRIDDPDSNEHEVIILRELYPRAKEDVLMLRPWSCSIRRAVVQQVAVDNKLVPWAYVYQLPVSPKCRLVEGLISKDIGAAGNYTERGMDYVVEGDKLMTDDPLHGVRYAADIDVHEMDAHVVNVLTARLAVLAAVPLRESLQLQQQKMQEYQSVYMSACGVEDRLTGPFGDGDNSRSNIGDGTQRQRHHRR